MSTVSVEIELDLPDGVTIRGYERHEGSHVFEVDFDLPERCRCTKCGHEAESNLRYRNDVLAIRDLDLQGQPSFWVYQPPLHQCPKCRQRTQIPAPFKRPRVTYTHRFEQFVLESLVGSSVEDVARRLSVSAEMVEDILAHQLAAEHEIPATAQISSLGMDELSLKKRHKLYVTVMSDLTDPEHPRVLARGDRAGPRGGGGVSVEAYARAAGRGAFASHGHERGLPAHLRRVVAEQPDGD